MEFKNIIQSVFKTTAIKAIELIAFGLIAGYYADKILKSSINEMESRIETKIKAQNLLTSDSIMLNFRALKESQRHLINGQIAIALTLKAHILKTSQEKKELINAIETLSPYLNFNEKKKSNSIQYCSNPQLKDNGE